MLRAYWELTRLHRFPGGTILTFWPISEFSNTRALEVLPKTHNVGTAAFFIGNTVRHSAACIWNDICDKDFDRQVVSIFGATVLFIALELFCCMNMLFAGYPASILGIFGLLVLDLLYPFMKRVTYWPQAWLGIAMTWGLPVSWLSLTGSLDWLTVPILFIGGIWQVLKVLLSHQPVSWTVYYDTIYACADRADDIKAGVKSTAILFGSHVTEISTCFAILFITSLVLAGLANSQGLLFFLVSVGGTAGNLFWQSRQINVNDKAVWRDILRVSKSFCVQLAFDSNISCLRPMVTWAL
ncbi:hypothetical protein GLOTRDRAFT_34372 [Gloeophyllum trabeum ATCC 11539]|uniref:UbiA prenyltransferase n=1 Tax=Gloeophyllum trabeum (strain ATCC 11539 / FP-39264 / Madison 617) TaxID=670483 RepID=S7QGZ6_GLOTA|nr:uncharacterized protein GLOTRDRAFT_34372 [Gloeophyllum trabeum ATCC 11539]EPQ59056.1 hypothetical protein GLOTRDRAFT_34372 [Gloeophyllum trabeum ATCC 11539]